MQVTVKYAEPMVKPVREVTLVLSPDEARVLKLICNWRGAVSETIGGNTGSQLDRIAVAGMLFPLWKVLHEQGVHSNHPEAPTARVGRGTKLKGSDKEYCLTPQH